MAAGHVWGIDIGQCGLKALRGRLSDDGQSVTVDSFDFIEYPQILSQPDANPDELVREALKTFLSRNSLRGDKVAISLSGQSGLARFIKLPPVDSKQLPNLVGFEAKQQIPFALEDVVWDYQRIPGTSMDELMAAGGDVEGGEEDDIPMETEVGLFAIKRDQVLRSIRPLVDSEVELDYIQLAPLAVYNAMSFDQLKCDEGYDSEKADNWIAILSMGTDNSDLVVTNGFRVWQRSVPIGGSHFTKQLTKDLKLTFAKAEHVKRNARDAKDAKQIFQAMRPVFSDLVTEVQRSIGYFGSLERSAEIKQLVMLGNAVKLPGLPQYMEKNLGMGILKLDEYARLEGTTVTEDGTFKDNLPSYAVCYGLILQGIGKGQMNTNLVPPEIIRARLIRRKKPWAAAIAASLLLACAFNFFFNYRAWDSVHPNREVNNISWDAAKSKVTTVKSTATKYESDDTSRQEQLERLNELGEATVGTDDGRKLWLELMKTITDCLPVDESLGEGPLPSVKDRPFHTRPEIHIDSIESQFFEDLSTWNTAAVQEKYQTFLNNRAGDTMQEAAAAAPPEVGEGQGDEEHTDAEVPEGPVTAVDEEERPPVEGSGWVIEVKGHHFQTLQDPKDRQYVRRTIMEQLESGRVRFPTADGQVREFGVKEMGILSPILVEGKRDKTFKVRNLEYQPPDPAPGQTGERQTNRVFGALQTPTTPTTEDPDNPQHFYPERFTFTIQFCWKQIPYKARLKAQQERLRLEQEEAQ